MWPAESRCSQRSTILPASADIESRVRQHLAHDVRQRLAGKLRRAPPSACHPAPASRRRPRPHRPSARSGKCVNTCVTTPGSRRHFAWRGQLRRVVERSVVVEVVRPGRRRHLGHAAEQSLRRPACAPARGRRRARPRTPRRAAACPSRFGALRGKVSGVAARARRAGSIHGQSAQAGFFGVQIVAPRSIIACAKSPARASGTSVCASAADLRLGGRQSRSIANSRATTRSTLPSTATARRSNAIAAIAAAV